MQEAETASEETAIVHYHEEEAVYINAQTDRVTVIFSTLFKDPDDIVIGKVPCHLEYFLSLVGFRPILCMGNCKLCHHAIHHWA